MSLRKESIRGMEASLPPLARGEAMLKFLKYASVLLALALATSCIARPNPLLGRWESVEFAPGYVEFRRDGTYSNNQLRVIIEGTYKVQGNKIVFTDERWCITNVG